MSDEKKTEEVIEETVAAQPEAEEPMKEAPKEEEVMHLINALAFDGAWAEQYEDFRVAEGQTFTNSKGAKEKVTMLNETISSYMHDDKAVAFSKPYEGYGFSFVFSLISRLFFGSSPGT